MTTLTMILSRGRALYRVTDRRSRSAFDRRDRRHERVTLAGIITRSEAIIVIYQPPDAAKYIAIMACFPRNDDNNESGNYLRVTRDDLVNRSQSFSYA